MMRFKIIFGFITIMLLYSSGVKGQKPEAYKISEDVVKKTSEILPDKCDYYTVEKSFTYSSNKNIGSLDNDAALTALRKSYASPITDLIDQENVLYLNLGLSEERKERLDAWRKKYDLENKAKAKTEAAQLEILCSYARFLHYDYIVNPEQLNGTLTAAYEYYKKLKPDVAGRIEQEEEGHLETVRDKNPRKEEGGKTVPPKDGLTFWGYIKYIFNLLLYVIIIGFFTFVLFFTGRGKTIRLTIVKTVKSLFQSSPPDVPLKENDKVVPKTETFDKEELYRLLQEDEKVKQRMTTLFLNMLKEDVGIQNAIIRMVQISTDSYGEISRQILNGHQLRNKIENTVDDKIEEALKKNKLTKEIPNYEEVYQPEQNQTPPPSTPTLGTYYSGTPQNGAFPGRELQREVKQGMTFYKLTISASGNEAVFRPVTEDETFQRAMDLPDTYLKPACDLIGDPKNSKSYKVKKDGLAIKENNNWKITEKATIEFS